jgi:transcriptional regulator with XRE-family HTH domain
MKNSISNTQGSNKLRFILRKLISDAGLTDIQLSRALGMPNTTLGQLLNSSTVSPRVETLLPIARYFKISIEQLIGEKPLTASSDTTHENKLPAANREFKEWNSILYIKCVEAVSKCLKKQKLVAHAEQVIQIANEVYFYSLKRSLSEIDITFIEWFIEHYLKQ